MRESTIRPPHRLAAAVVLCAVAMTAAVAPAEEDDDRDWDGEVSLSFTAQTGTVDTLAGSVDAETSRNWTNDKLTFRFNGVYGRTRDRSNSGPDGRSRDETIQDAQGIFSIWRHDYTERIFQKSTTELSRDATQNRKVRAAVDSSPGVRVWKGARPKKKHFDLYSGFGFRFERFDGNAGGAPSENSDDRYLVDFVAGFQHKNLFFEEKLEFTHTARIRMPANDPDVFIVVSEVIIGIPLTASWSFRTSFWYEYLNDVPDDTNNSTTRTAIGLGYKF